jgi:hypothetical protein
MNCVAPWHRGTVDKASEPSHDNLHGLTSSMPRYALRHWASVRGSDAQFTPGSASSIERLIDCSRILFLPLPSRRGSVRIAVVQILARADVSGLAMDNAGSIRRVGRR